MFVGGDAAALDRARPMLETFCKHIFHTGEVGSGNVIKLTGVTKDNLPRVLTAGQQEISNPQQSPD